MGCHRGERGSVHVHSGLRRMCAVLSHVAHAHHHQSRGHPAHDRSGRAAGNPLACTRLRPAGLCCCTRACSPPAANLASLAAAESSQAAALPLAARGAEVLLNVPLPILI